MNRSAPLSAPPLRLSREELTVVLVALNAPLIVGMDVEEVTLSPDQQRLVLWAAQRALIARRLAGMNHEGQFELHDALLRLLAPCAFADQALLVHYWPPGRELPIHLFAHQRGDEIVLHTLPVRGLHEFTLLPSTEALVGVILGQPELEGAATTDSLVLRFPVDALYEARALAEQGAIEAAAARLNGNNRAAALALATTLAAGPAITVLQQVVADGTMVELTWLRDSDTLWVVEASGSEGVLSARTLSKAALAARLLTLLI